MKERGSRKEKRPVSYTVLVLKVLKGFVWIVVHVLIPIDKK